jgi:hypothetical protein
VQHKRNGLVIVCGLAATMLLGCQNDEIRSYRVPKPESKPATRLLAVIIPHGDQTWFFKLVGPVSQIEEHKQAFDDFVRTVRFTDQADAPITWTLPAGWRAGPASNLRYATFYLGPQENALELTVFKFGGVAGSVLMNVNRWRGQMGLKDIPESELSKFSKDLKLDCGPATLVDMTNPGAGKAVPEPRLPLRYEKPEGWKEAPDPSGISLVLFQIAEGGRSAKVTITALPGDAGGLMKNVNRWRGQIGLGPVDEQQLGKEVHQIEVAGTMAPYVDLRGPEAGAGSPPRILGVLLPRGGRTWFFKMQGPADLIEKQKPVFDAFVKSVRFE